MDKTTFQVAIYEHLNIGTTHSVTREEAVSFAAVLLMLVDVTGTYGKTEVSTISLYVIKTIRDMLSVNLDVYHLDEKLCARITYLKTNLWQTLKPIPSKEWGVFVAQNEQNIEAMRKMARGIPNGYYYYKGDLGIATGDVKVYQVMGEVLPAGKLKEVYTDRWVAYQLVSTDGGEKVIYTRELSDFYERMLPYTEFSFHRQATPKLEVSFGLKPQPPVI